MTSPSPLLYDTYYHIYNRGTNRENIFIEQRNYEYFLNLFSRHIVPVAELFAYCLLRNHFHMLVRVKSEEEILEFQKTLKVSSASSYPDQPEMKFKTQDKDIPEKPLGSDYPSKRFSNFFNAYAKAINKAYGRTGSLFQHPFGRVMVTSDHQFWNVIAYIHQNPQKHKFVDDFWDWEYTSYGVMLTNDPTCIQREAVLDWFGGRDQYRDLHAGWVTDARSKWFAGDDLD